MSAVDPQTPIDSPSLWAAQYFPIDSNRSLDETDRLWLSQLEESVENTGHKKWLAYQVSRGDELNWNSATKASDWESIEVLSEQLRSFVGSFLDLPPNQRRTRFASLEKSLQHNPIARNRLEIFRPLLDLNSIARDSLTPDVKFLMQSAAKVLIEKPANRRAGLDQIMSIVAKDPARWEQSATHIRNHCPQINQIAPELFLRVSKYRLDQKQFRSQEKTTLRRASFARMRASINNSMVFKGVAAIYFTFLILNAVVTTFRESAKVSQNQSTSTILGLGKEQKQESGLKVPPNLQLLVEDLLLQPEKHVNELKMMPAPEGLLATMANYRKKWETLAVAEGMAGLDAFEKSLRKLLGSPDGALAADADQVATTPPVDPIKREVYEMRLRFFARWRALEGDQIAKSYDEKRQADKNALRLPLLDQSKDTENEQ
ncbi:MAG: hypothetical protein NTW52_07610 [Planctomycetota bacterium]|nr:hypothetical protein [Planctomycetota bacterium]